jgi:hypothetical protein
MARRELGSSGSTLLKAVPVVLLGVFGFTRVSAMLSPAAERNAPPQRSQTIEERRAGQAPVWASIRGAGEGIVQKMDEAGVRSGNVRPKEREGACTMREK